ncbi:MAG: hypothetical protein KAI74_04465 [Kiritimatiellae bacterium]|nr:hypothetical protein [Kiritimatiellia bacterium]
MIFDPGDMIESKPSVVVTHIQSEIADICGVDVATEFCRIEVAKAIEYFLENEHDSEFIESKTLTMLAAKVLASTGDPGSARRLMLFSSGMVKPSEWVVTGDKDVWVLNLKEITMQEDASLELIFFRGVQLVLDSIADVWDECAGDGVLGLRHVCLAAASLLGAPRNSRAVAVLSDEIIDTSIAKLEQLKGDRGWTSVPFVLNLDFK